MSDSIRIEIVYPHSVEQVWFALTDSAAMAEWLMPNDFEPKVGHRFALRAPAQLGWNGLISGEVLEVQDRQRLSYTWQGHWMPQTVVTFTLEPVAEGTRLCLEHSGFAGAGLKGFLLRAMMGSGWNSRMLRQRFPVVLSKLATHAPKLGVI